MITIIGAGWYGCYIGLSLKKQGIEFEILEKENDIFVGSSGYNQNRLHRGYHYPRDYTTRITSLNGFKKFVSKFPHLSLDIQNNLYAVHEDSYIDFQTYLSIYSHEKYQFQLVDDEFLKKFKNYQGVIAVDEKLIDFKSARKFFIDHDLPIRFGKICEYNENEIFANGRKIDSEIILDCTYGQLRCPEGFFNEDFLSLVYLRKNKTSFGALTVMNGEFYSIYPYYDDLFTVTGVKEGIVNLAEYSCLGEENYVYKRRSMLERKILEDYKNFLDDFEYSTYFISKKTKPLCNTDKRSTELIIQDNIYTICSGKIDTIFEIDDMIQSIIKKAKNKTLKLGKN